MAYLRARRSIKLGPGVKVNLNKHSVGMTVGGRGAHYSVNSRGTRTKTVGLPGTGLSYIDRSSTRQKSTRSARPASRATAAAPARPATQAHPGLLARHYERAFYNGVQKLIAGQTQSALADFRDADESDDKHRAISPALLVGMLLTQLGDQAGAVPYLERVTKSAQPLPDELITKYAPDLAVTVLVDEQVRIPMAVGSPAATVLLAESYAATNRLPEAIGLMQQVHDHAPTTPMLLMLCDLYRQAGDWDEIVHVTAGLSNEDNLTLLARLWQADAMEHQNLPDAALEVYRDALKSKKRDAQLLKQARYSRAALYVKAGKTAMAKRDLGRLYADDPDYKDVATLLPSLG
jgi:tetratricopeptide (TPR) repeat protein